MNDKTPITGTLKIELKGPDGKVKQTEVIKNLVTTVGKNSTAAQLIDTPGIAKPSHMAVGTGTNAAAAGDTTLQTELDRNALTSKTRSTNVVTYVGDWAAGDATGSITEAGIFNAASAGDMYNRAVFTAIAKGASDTLKITWTTTVG